MTNILDEICRKRQADTREMRRKTPIRSLFQDIKSAPSPRGFAQALRHAVNDDKIGLIAEVKRASPSEGEIKKDFDALACAKTYEMAGATCLSVLTEPHWFKGNIKDLDRIRQSVALPLLRKDFIVDPYQILESRIAGADCILLIMAALSGDQAMELADTAKEYEMDILVEVHNHEERDRVLNTGMKFDLFGINNRNLKNMMIDLNTTVELARDLPSDILTVCESGIKTPQDIRKIRTAGTHCFLIGTTLMKAPDLYKATQSFLKA